MSCSTFQNFFGKTFGDEVIVLTTTYTRWKRFKNCRKSLDDDKRNRKPSTAVHDENVVKVRDAAAQTISSYPSVYGRRG